MNPVCSDGSLPCILWQKDLGAFWAMMQFGAVLGALVIGFVTILVGRNVYRLDNSFKLNERYFNDNPLSAADGILRMKSANMQLLPLAIEKVGTDYKSAEAAARDLTAYNHEALIAVHNFFDDASELYKRKLIDRDYFMNRFRSVIKGAASLTPPFYKLYKNLSAISDEGIRYLDQERIKYEKKHRME